MPDADYRVRSAGCGVRAPLLGTSSCVLLHSLAPLLYPLVCRMLPAAGLLGCNLAHLGPGSLLVDAAHCKIGSSRAANAAGKVTASGGLISPARPMQTPCTHTHTHTHIRTHTGTFTVARALLISKSSECYYSVIYSTNATAAAPPSACSLALTLSLTLPLPFPSLFVHMCISARQTNTLKHPHTTHT